MFVPIEVTSYIEIKQGAVKFGRKSRGFPWTLTIRPKISEEKTGLAKRKKSQNLQPRSQDLSPNF